MGNSPSDLFLFNTIVNQLNNVFASQPPGPITPFITQLNVLRSDVTRLQLNEPSEANLASINNSILSLTSSLQIARDDIIALQNQAVDAMTLQNIQTSITDLSNSIIALQTSVSTVNVVNLNTLVNTINATLNNLMLTVNSKADKSTSINGKQLSNNITLTKTDIGLSLVTNDQQLKRAANDFRSFPVRSVISGNDIILLEDHEVGGSKYAAPVSAIPISEPITVALSGKANKLSIAPITAGASNKTLSMNVNADGQITSLTESLINITPAQANLGSVVNSDTTNIANTFIRNTFLPLNSTVAVNDSGLNALQKLQGQINSRLVTMTGATVSSNGVTGLVPQPLLGQNNSFLRGDGVWTNNTMNVSSISAALNPAVVNTIYLATSGGFNITLPIPTVSGGSIVVVDTGNNFSASPVVLVPSGGGVINQSTSPLSLTNSITTLYFNLPNNWTVQKQFQPRTTLSVAAAVITNPTITDASYATLATMPTVIPASAEEVIIDVATVFTGINIAVGVFVTLSLTVLDNVTSSVIEQVLSTIYVKDNGIIRTPFKHIIFPSGVATRIRIDAIMSTPATTLVNADYDFATTYKIVTK